MQKSLLVLLLSPHFLSLANGQLDLPHQPAATRRTPQSARPVEKVTETPSNKQQQQPQPQQQPALNQPPYPYFNNYNPHDFGGPPPHFQFGFSSPYPHPNFNNQQPNKNGTNPVNPSNNFGPYDSNFGPGYFGYGAPHQRPFNFQYPSGQSQAQQNAAPQNPKGKKDSKEKDPNAEEVPVSNPNPGYGQFPPGFNSFPNQNGLNFGPIPSQFPTFRPHFGQFDYGFGGPAAPPQTIGHNIQVGGLVDNGIGPVPVPSPGGPVAGFYGPPPNIGHYGGFSGFPYQQPLVTSPTHQPSATVEKPQPEVVIK